MTCSTVQLNLAAEVAAGCGVPCYRPCVRARHCRCTVAANHAAAGNTGNCSWYAPTPKTVVPEGRP